MVRKWADEVLRSFDAVRLGARSRRLNFGPYDSCVSWSVMRLWLWLVVSKLLSQFKEMTLCLRGVRRVLQIVLIRTARKLH